MSVRDDIRFDPARYWRDRAGAVGHTGWKRPAVYVFDQLERLALVAQTLKSFEHAGSARALDFGSGSGDFSRLLLDAGLEVVGHDPFMTTHLQHPRFRFVAAREAVEALSERFELILSVTVLDHILPPAEFHDTLRLLARLLAPGGKLLLLEYAPDHEAPSPSEHQAYRPFRAWEDALGAAGLSVRHVEPVPHPNAAPSPGYRRYRRRLVTRLLARVPASPATRRLVSAGLRLQARADLRRHGVGKVAASPLKLMTCSRTHET